MSNQHEYFALAVGSTFEFVCVSKTAVIFEQKVTKAFYNWSQLQPKGSTPAMADFLSKYKKVIIKVEKMES